MMGNSGDRVLLKMSKNNPYGVHRGNTAGDNASYGG